MANNDVNINGRVSYPEQSHDDVRICYYFTVANFLYVSN